MKGLMDSNNILHMYKSLKGRWSSNLATLHQILTELWPLFYSEFGQITMSGWLLSKVLMDSNNILECMHITIKRRSSSNLVTLHQILAELWPLFDSEFWKNDHFRMVTHVRIDGSKWNFAYMYTFLKGRWSTNLATLHHILTELWRLFYLDFGKLPCPDDNSWKDCRIPNHILHI